MMSLSVCACLSVPDHIFVHVPSSKIFLHVTYGHKEEKTCEDYRCRVGGKVEEAKWKGLGVNDHWQLMKGIMMETAQDISGMTKGPPRHKETW